MNQSVPNEESVIGQAPPREPVMAGNRFSIKLFIIAFVLTAAVLAWLSWSTYNLYATNKIIEEQIWRTEELRGTIIHLDEVLTMSAKMAAATGDPEWEARYRGFEPQLDTAIKELLKLDPSHTLVQTDTANRRLVEMENQAFGLVSENHTAEAQALLSSQNYETQKAIYGRGITNFFQQLEAQIEAGQRLGRNRAIFSVGAGIVVLAVLLFSWLAVIRLMYRTQAVLLVSITRRKQTEEVLREAQHHLEEGVRERTSELTVANTSLKQQISERQRAEAALRESEESYRDLFDNAQDAIYVHDLDGIYTSANRAAEKLAGYARGEILGKNFAEFIAPEDIDRVRANLRTKPDHNGSTTYEIEVLTKDGRRVPVEVNSRLIYDKGAAVGVQGIARDITERKRTAAALQESEARYRDLIQNANDIIYTLDLSGGFTSLNRAGERIIGYSLDEALRMNIADVIGPDDAECMRQRISMNIAGAGVPDFELDIFAKDGTTVTLEISSRMMFQDGVVVGIQGIGRDINERKRAEAEVKVIAEIIHGVFATTSLDELFTLAHVSIGKLLSAENCFIALHDLDTNLMHFDFWVDKFDPVPLPGPVDKNFSGYVLRTGQPLLLTEERKSQLYLQEEVNMSGTPSASWLGVPLRIGSRSIGVLVVQHYEKTNVYSERDREFLAAVGDQLGMAIERKQIEVELKESELELVEAQRIAQLGSWSWDVATNTTSWSEALYDVYGLTREDFPATVEGYLGLVHPDDRENISSMVEAALRTCQASSYEHRILWPDKSVRFHHVNLKVVVDDHGSPVKLVGTAQDISDRVQMEGELKDARDSALESARLKSEFLANMSHEIRTPMNGVIGMTGLLLETELTSSQREFADIIQSSSNSLLTIINDILDFSKIEAGLLRFEKIDFDLLGTVEAPVELLAERAQSKGLELASLVHRDVPTELRGDPGRIRQVLTNLIGNAVKFTNQGEVVVSVRKISETHGHVTLGFEIRDTGIGISTEAQRGLFRAFIQADGSTTRKFGGTGLGLAISKQLVELMGGEIGIESAPGRGSTFWFTGRFEKQLNPAPRKAEPAGDLSGARVLIVDDNATNRNILKQQTSSWGMVPSEAESGNRALELLRAAANDGEPYDIAVLDLMMPEMDGFQLAEAIKSDPTIAAVVLVLLPSFAKRGHGQRARQAGIAAYLQKPVRQSQLYNCLTTVMAQPESELATESLLVTRHSLRESKVQPKDKTFSSVRILIAEDNLVNQKVAEGLLYNLGYRADSVPNGRELLEALENERVDIILMDCQMPEMDGFAATKEIRRLEGTVRHTIIIAMTANALDGDRERCLAAGMDDYLSKPVKSEALRLKLEHWTKPHDSEKALSEDNQGVQHASGGVIDQVQLASLRSVQQPGESDFVTELIDLFLNQSELQLKALGEAVVNKDAVELRRLAHLLKGSSANIGARSMAALYEEMEGQDRTNGAGEALFARIEKEFAVLSEALKAERRGVHE